MYICELTTVNSIPTVVKTTHQSFHLVGITLARKMDAEEPSYMRHVGLDHTVRAS